MMAVQRGAVAGHSRQLFCEGLSEAAAVAPHAILLLGDRIYATQDAVVEDARCKLDAVDPGGVGL